MDLKEIDTREAMRVIADTPKGQGGGRVKKLMREYGLTTDEARKLNTRIFRMEEKAADDIENTSVTEDNNSLTAVCTSNKRKAIDDLLEEFGIEKDDYFIKEGRVGKWGNPDKPMAQVRVELRPKKPQLCDFPEISAVRPRYTNPPKTLAKSKKKLKRALIVPDAQIGYEKRDVHKNEFYPYHDFDAMDVVLQVAQHTKPDKIIMLGDMLDLPNFGKYAKKPQMLFTVQPSLNTLKCFIDDLLQNCSEMVYLYGNHEARFRNFMEDVNIEGSQLKKVDFKEESPFTYSLEYFLGLDELGVKYFNNYPHDEYFLNDNLAFSHGHTSNSKSGGTVGGIIQNDPHTSRFVGHIHRCEQATKTTYKRGRAVTNSAFSCGALCKIDASVPQHATRQNWQQGFGLVWYEEGDGLFDVDLHHIEHGKAIVEGNIFTSRFDAKKMSKRIGFDIV